MSLLGYNSAVISPAGYQICQSFVCKESGETYHWLLAVYLLCEGNNPTIEVSRTSKSN